MKKYLPLLLVLITILNGCKKNDDETTTEIQDPSEFFTEVYNLGSEEYYNQVDNLLNSSPPLDLTNEEFVIVPIKFHDIRRSDGGGSALNQNIIPSLLSRLNSNFETARLEFVQCGDVNIIEDSDLYEFPEVSYEVPQPENTVNFNFLQNLMSQYNTPNTLNIYLPKDIDGAGGFYPGLEQQPNLESMIMVDKDLLGFQLVVEHEIGHWLYLRHTHGLGNIGATSNELVNGSNCSIAGDLICDTPADPNLYGLVNSDCDYIGNSIDANDDFYNPDTENIMSYTRTGCRTRFSNLQLLRMGASMRSPLRDFVSVNACGGQSSGAVIELSGSLNFGNVNVGQSTTKIFQILNTGSEVLNVTDIDFPFPVYSSTWNSGIIQANSSVSITVTFQPTSSQNYNGQIVVESNADSGTNTITVTGTGVNNSGTSIIALSGSLNFGNVNVGQNATRTLRIQNTGSEVFSVSNVIYPYPVYSSTWTSGTIQPGGFKDVTVVFEPNSEGNYNGSVTVVNNSDTGSNTVQISGTGIDNSGSSIISLSGNLSFGSVEVGQSDTRNFTISNTGNEDFYVSDIGFPSNVYSASWNTGTVSPGNPRNVTVTFQPTSAQNYNGVVYVNSNADSGNNNISISGNGTNNQFVILSYNNHLVKDGSGGGVGNNNGTVDAGEEIDLDVQLINTGNSIATNVSATLSTNDSDINITDDYESWADISAGLLEWEDDFDFNVSSNCPTKTVTFYLQITSDQGNWNDSFTINVQGQSGGNNPISITPTNSCSSAPVMQVDTEYEVSIDVGDYEFYTPTGGESYQGDNIRGFWIELDVPSSWSGNHVIAITDVSSNFDPVIGLKGVCSSTFYLYQPNISLNYGNFNGLGENDVFVFNANASINYYIRIYHYYGYQTPNISFKIIVE